MSQYSSLNIILCNSQLNKLNSEKKTVTEVTLNFSSNVSGGSNDKTNSSHELNLLDH